LTVLVLDASVVLAWAIEDERHVQAVDTLTRLRSSDEARVPALWWFEVRNALASNERRGRLTEADTATLLRGIARLPVATDRSPDETGVLTLARRHRLTVYDAAYLELAQREGLPLASLDRALRGAATVCGVALLGD
jgi:predicted nucleic acid-binding protein